jgi:phage terminase large subunit
LPRCRRSTTRKAIDRSLIEADRKLYHAMFGDDAGDALIEQEYFCSFAAAVLGSYYGKALNRLEHAGRIRGAEYDPRCRFTRPGISARAPTWRSGASRSRTTGSASSTALQGAHDEVIPDLVEKLNALPYVKWGNDYVPHDAKVKEIGTGKTRVETLVALKRRPVLVPDHKIDDGISAARLLLPKCWFDATNASPGSRRCASTRPSGTMIARCSRTRRCTIGASHFADAFRYLAMVARELIGAHVAEEPSARAARRGDEKRAASGR